MKKNIPVLTCIIYLFSLSCLAQMSTFNYTGSMQIFVVPATVASVDVDVRGAEGAPDGAGLGTAGLGGRVQATLAVTPGETLYVFVGGAAAPFNGGYNGGGNGGVANTGPTGGGGGGMSDIRQGGNLFSDIVIAAGGGGGCGGYTGVSGGNGGDAIAQPGTDGAGMGGGGGSQNSGGTGGVGGGQCGLAGTSGNQGQGGTGGNTTCGSGFGGGGGGGAGYYGGGGGGAAANLFCCPDWSGGGGGGSSYTNLSVVSNITHTQGFQNGNGVVSISYIITGNAINNELQGIEIFPNPVSEFFVLSYVLLGRENISMKIFDVKGRLVKSYEEKYFDKGKHQMQFDTRDESGNKLSAGIYVLQLSTDKQTLREKLVIQ